MVEQVISGAQTGADEAGLDCALAFGVKTGGTMPFGYRTLKGCRPDYRTKYGVVAHSSSAYPPRTKKNVKDGTGTIRLAYDFESPGEICTLKAIESYKKPNFKVDLKNPPPISEAVEWVKTHDIKILNVAGNSEETAPGTYAAVFAYLSDVFRALGFSMTKEFLQTIAKRMRDTITTEHPYLLSDAIADYHLTEEEAHAVLRLITV